MFKKLKLKRQLKKVTRSIEELEQKRLRSQSALVEAILTNTTPTDDDVDYFNLYTDKINERRNELSDIKKQLNDL